MDNELTKAEIKFIDELLQMNLKIPNYQRPYKWTRKNVAELLDDIEVAIADKKRYRDDFRYRIGTVILHEEKDKNGKTQYNIVDGQQRIITLSLIKYFLNSNCNNTILKHEFANKETIFHLQDNYSLIKDRLSIKGETDRQSSINSAFVDTLEVVVLKVDELSEAFQLFDSQNTRGKGLYPHDLLKAYHLREMDDLRFEKLRLVKEWEQIKPNQIKTLFSAYLYPILNWSRKEGYKEFNSSSIDEYKGVSSNCKYTYAQRVCKAMPYFQINEPFCAGSDFFKMTSHYIHMLEDIRSEIKNNFTQISDIFKKNIKRTKNNDERYSSTGFRYAVNLFYCALLFYYDRFHSLDEVVVKKLFVWAMMLRVNMRNLGLDTINKYALGDSNGSYSNHIPMFYKIACARKVADIADLDVRVETTKVSDIGKKLYEDLLTIAGVNNNERKTN